MKRTVIILLTLALAASAWADDYKVVVHRSNAITSLTKTQVADYFFKRTTVWPDKAPIVAVDQPANSPTRETFSREILRRPVAAVKNHWHQQVFSGRELPPVEKAGDRAVIQFIKSTPGAIGYVSASADTGDVKVIAVD